MWFFFTELHGIHKQAYVGFLTLMESLRYCKVPAHHLPVSTCSSPSSNKHWGFWNSPTPPKYHHLSILSSKGESTTSNTVYWALHIFYTKLSSQQHAPCENKCWESSAPESLRLWRSTQLWLSTLEISMHIHYVWLENIEQYFDSHMSVHGLQDKP